MFVGSLEQCFAERGHAGRDLKDEIHWRQACRGAQVEALARGIGCA